LGSGLTIRRSMPASKVRGPLHVHSVTIVGSCESATTRSATGQTLPVVALGRDDRVFAPLTTLRYRVHGDVCGFGRVLVLPVTPEIIASFVAAAKAAPAARRRVGR
jgi:hypothetical protein